MLIIEYCRWVQDRLRTPNGRRIVLANIDTTHVRVDKSTDAFVQQQTYSGARGYKHCVYFSNITASNGEILAVTPGPNIACTPRGGDGVSLGVQLGLAQQQESDTGTASGFTRLLREAFQIVKNPLFLDIPMTQDYIVCKLN